MGVRNFPRKLLNCFGQTEFWSKTIVLHCKCLQGIKGCLWGNQSTGISNLPGLHVITVEGGSTVQKKITFFGVNTETTISRYTLMFFYVFKIAVAIAFFRENAVNAKS